MSFSLHEMHAALGLSDRMVWDPKDQKTFSETGLALAVKKKPFK